MDKMRFMEQKTRNFWNDYFQKQAMPGGSYVGKKLPVFNYVILGDSVLLYSNFDQIALMEAFDWSSKEIRSFRVTEANHDFWEMSGFDKRTAILDGKVKVEELNPRSFEL